MKTKLNNLQKNLNKEILMREEERQKDKAEKKLLKLAPKDKKTHGSAAASPAPFTATAPIQS